MQAGRRPTLAPREMKTRPDCLPTWVTRPCTSKGGTLRGTERGFTTALREGPTRQTTRQLRTRNLRIGPSFVMAQSQDPAVARLYSCLDPRCFDKSQILMALGTVLFGYRR